MNSQKQEAMSDFADGERSDRRWFVMPFLQDRLLYIAFFYIAIVFVLLVVSLERLREGFIPNISNILYMFVLATAVVLGWLIWDYLRQYAYYRQTAVVLSEKEPDMEAFLRIQGGVTREQQATQRLLERQYRSYSEELAEYRRQREQHLHFANQWVHHMKTPVSVIDLLVQQADELPEGMSGAPLFHSIQEENERIAHGLDMMLHTARLDYFNLDVRIERVSLLPLVRRVINGHKKACIRASIFPRVEGEDAAPETDDKWLSFVLNQLVTNAIKYSKNKPGSKQLLFVVKNDGAGCSLSVTDEGIGIAEQDLGRVFDPFFTGENGRLVEESTGIGLYLAKQVCSRLGHTIVLDSTLGAGTTVTIHLSTASIHRGLIER